MAGKIITALEAAGQDYSKAQFTRRARLIEIERVTGALAEIVADWQETGANLFEVQSSPALFLADVLYRLGLDPADQVAALGPELARKLSRCEIL